MSDPAKLNPHAQLPAKTGKKRGRPSKREEAAALLEQLGLPADTIDALDLPQVSRKDLPETPEEIRQEAIRLMWEALPSLTNVAKVQALRFLADATNTEDDSKTDEPELTVAEVIQGVPGVPPERRRSILEAERDRLAAEVAHLETALANTEVAA